MDSNIKELIAEHKSHLFKFVYYIIALNVACVGFCIANSLDISAQLNHLPLAISVALFCFSIYSGFQYIQIVISTYHSDIKSFLVNNETAEEFTETYYNQSNVLTKAELKNALLKGIERATEVQFGRAG